MLRKHIGKRSRLYIFYFSGPRSNESIGKPILSRRDEVLLNEVLAQSA